VYAVGHAAISRHGCLLAAVKACGPGAMLSHQSAGELWGLLPTCPGPIHVKVSVQRHPRSVRGISVHRSRTIHAADATHRDRIPVTTALRTVLDLRRVLPRKQWEAVVDQARGKGVPVDDLIDEAPTRSVLERRFLRLCRCHRIPAPKVNVRIGRFVVDFLWPEHRIVVEVDGYEFHGGRQSFEADRERDAELAVQGYRVLRFTYRQVTEEPAKVAARLSALLG